MATLTVIAPFGSYTRGQTITDATTVAVILGSPNKVYVVEVADGSSTSPGGGSSPDNPGTTPSGLTLADVDGEIATALTSKGLPSGSTIPALIAAAIAAQGSGSGVSAAQATALALVLG